MALLIKWIAQNSHKPPKGMGLKIALLKKLLTSLRQSVLSIIYEYRLDASDLARKEKKAVRAELQKSIDENLEALKEITNI